MTAWNKVITWGPVSAGAGRNPVLAVVFDGAVCTDETGGPVIPAEAQPVPHALEWLADNRDKFQIVLVSSRFVDLSAMRIAAGWMVAHGFPKRFIWWQDLEVEPDGLSANHAIRFSMLRPPAIATIDAHALTFEGDWGAFKEWTIKERARALLQE